MAAEESKKEGKEDLVPVASKGSTICIRWYDPDTLQFVSTKDLPSVSFFEFYNPKSTLSSSEKRTENGCCYTLTPLERPTIVGVKIAETGQGDEATTLVLWAIPDRESPCIVDLPYPRSRKLAKYGNMHVFVSKCQGDGKEPAKGQPERTPISGITVTAEMIAEGSKAPRKLVPSSLVTERSDERGLAVLSLRSGCTYEINVPTSSSYAPTEPRLPVLVHLCDGEDIELGICLQPCERTVTLIFADSCGKPIKGFSFRIDNKEYQADTGVFNITSAQEGAINLFSQNWELNPSQVHIGKAMAQAFVVQTTRRTVSLPPRTMEEEGIIIEFAQFEPEKKASVRILTIEGIEVGTADTDANGIVHFPAKKGEQYAFEAFVDGILIEKFTLTA